MQREREISLPNNEPNVSLTHSFRVGKLLAASGSTAVSLCGRWCWATIMLPPQFLRSSPVHQEGLVHTDGNLFLGREQGRKEGRSVWNADERTAWVKQG